MQKGTIQEKSSQKQQDVFTSCLEFRSKAFELKKEVVQYVLRNSLLESGEGTLELVYRSLLEKYRCDLSDCYEKPEYLIDVLKYVYDEAYQIIVDSIKKDLNKFAHEGGIKEFVRVLEVGS